MTEDAKITKILVFDFFFFFKKSINYLVTHGFLFSIFFSFLVFLLFFILIKDKFVFYKFYRGINFFYLFAV
jgi:hypothetical protein